jgi:hypothetical protein
MIFEPVGVFRLESLGPLEEPQFRALQARIKALGRLAIYDMPMAGLLADLFSHRCSPFGFLISESIVKNIFRQGNRCPDAKMTLKSN